MRTRPFDCEKFTGGIFSRLRGTVMRSSLGGSEAKASRVTWRIFHFARSRAPRSERATATQQARHMRNPALRWRMLRGPPLTRQPRGVSDVISVWHSSAILRRISREFAPRASHRASRLAPSTAPPPRGFGRGFAPSSAAPAESLT